MKIVMATRAVFPYHGYGGMQLYIYNLAKHMVANGHKVEIVTSYMGKKEIFSENYEGITYTFIPVKTSEMHNDNTLNKVKKQKGLVQKIREKVPPAVLAPIAFLPTIGFLLLDTYRFRKFSKELSKYLSDKEFDILHFYDLAGYHYTRSSNAKPTVMQAFGNESFFDTRAADYIGYSWFRQLVKTCFKKSAVVGTCGDINAADIIKISAIPKQKIKMMQNGIDFQKIPKETKQKCRQELGLELNQKIFVTVNRLSPDKHVDRIIKGFHEAKIKNSMLICIGGGIEEQKLIALSQKISANVKFLKGLSDETLYKYLKASDAFINAADTRYLLLTVLESMACGLPIISTFPMEDSVDESNGIITHGNDEHSIAKAINALPKDLHKLSIESRKRAQQFAWSQVAKEDLKIYEQIIEFERKT